METVCHTVVPMHRFCKLYPFFIRINVGKRPRDPALHIASRAYTAVRRYGGAVRRIARATPVGGVYCGVAREEQRSKSGWEAANGSGDASPGGTKAESRTSPAGNWRDGIVPAIVGIVAGSRSGMESRRGGIARMDGRVGHGRFANSGLRRVEPQRDITEPDPRAAIMLAGGSDDCRSRGFAASELKNLAERK